MALQSYKAFCTLLLFAFVNITLAQSLCKTWTSPPSTGPIIADGWRYNLVANGLRRPRSIVLDTAGNVLVLEQGRGIAHLENLQRENEDEEEPCLRDDSATVLVGDASLNHGLQLSLDGKTVYASSSDEVYSWPYDASAKTVGEMRTLVTGMQNGGHVTRTLLISKKEPGWLVVSRGSDGDVDPLAMDISSGHSQLKAFFIGNMTEDDGPFDFNTQGKLLGWGLRNSVGVGEDPATGGIFTVENSVDNVPRDRGVVATSNPGEEMNFHGYLNGSTEGQGGNYGYLNCLALWDTNLPASGGLTVGDQFFNIDEQVEGLTEAAALDLDCNKDRVSPRLTFESHTAPLDIKFSNSGDRAYVSFHGGRYKPVRGYKVSSIAFSNGQPVAPPNSTNSTEDIIRERDVSDCPSGPNCFRPTGLFVDNQDRIWLTTDASGEIWVMQKVDGTPGSPSSPSHPDPTGGQDESPAPSDEGAGSVLRVDAGSTVLIFAIVLWLYL